MMRLNSDSNIAFMDKTSLKPKILLFNFTIAVFFVFPFQIFPFLPLILSPLSPLFLPPCILSRQKQSVFSLRSLLLDVCALLCCVSASASASLGEREAKQCCV